MSTNQLSAELTIFHITHWKAGSQWIHRILTDCAPDRIILPVNPVKHFLEAPIIEGAIYPTVYVTKDQFYSVSLPPEYCKFIVIRDLRDTLISGYFSVLYSHQVLDDDMEQCRKYLVSASIQSGLLHMIEIWLPTVAAIQQSWLKSGDEIIRYEDLLVNDFSILEDTLITRGRLRIARQDFQGVIEKYRFENFSGRKRGQEDIASHERKGLPGDWKNHFTRAVAKSFNDKFGKLLVEAGYEQGQVWAANVSKSHDTAPEMSKVVEALTGSLRKARAECDALSERVAELRKFQTSALEQINTLTAMVHRSQEEAQELRRFQSSAIDQVNTLTAEVNKATAEAAELRKFQFSALGQIDTLTTALREARAQADELRGPAEGKQ